MSLDKATKTMREATELLTQLGEEALRLHHENEALKRQLKDASGEYLSLAASAIRDLQDCKDRMAKMSCCCAGCTKHNLFLKQEDII